MEIAFHDRTEAGKWLAGPLAVYAGRAGVIVLGLPRGGVVVAYEVAKTLRAPLDVCVVRKLGTPGSPELAMGAIASGGVYVLDQTIVQGYHISAEAIKAVKKQEEVEFRRREQLYRGGRPPLCLEGRTVILIDDGLATGCSMRAAILAVRRHHPARLVAAVPVGAAGTCDELQGFVDELVCSVRPMDLQAIGHWYANFSSTSDEEVCRLLESARAEQGAFASSKGAQERA